MTVDRKKVMRIQRSGCLLLVAALVAVPTVGSAQAADSSARVTLGAFMDTYYAYDFNRPRTLDRAYTTQAARHNEFNVNLAFVDATLAAPRLRGRVALQVGTAVQANYAAEPHVGTLSGPEVSRFIQEAYAGYQLHPDVWVDAGIFFSPFGSESWISRDNWTYTRSLVADNSPFYEAGVRATWQATPKLSAQLHVINGWQNVSETNSDKALGIRLDYAPSRWLSVAYDGFLGNEAPDSTPARMRQWHEGFIEAHLGRRVGVRATLDVGHERRPEGATDASWHGEAVLTRVALSERVAVTGRLERYADPEQVIVSTGSATGFRANGWSATVDVSPAPRLMWRAETRWLGADSQLFPSRVPSVLKRNDLVLLTSVTLRL